VEYGGGTFEREPPTLPELETLAAAAVRAMDEFRKRATQAVELNSREEELRKREEQLGRRRDRLPLTGPESVWEQVTGKHDALLAAHMEAMTAASAAETAAFDAQQSWDTASEEFLDALVAYEDSLGGKKANRWRDAAQASFSEGEYRVVLTSAPVDSGMEPWSFGSFMVVWAAARAGLPLMKALEIERRLAHLGPEEVMAGISFEDAIALKHELAALGAKAEIVETTHGSSTSRPPIPERVRHEMWRRDEGRCVDCGGRERLEFDHIIPLSRGGSNTARNLELPV
jgi:HNH endonuclease